MVDKTFRSSCLIASALDIIGDRWSLIIVRDMLLFKKKTFKELIASDEGVATNLLSSRLKMLESLLLITKRKLPRNKKENIYLLTDRGIDMAPIVMELAIWSDKHARSFNPEMNAIENGYKDKAQVIDSVQRTYREFANSVIESGVTS